MFYVSSLRRRVERRSFKDAFHRLHYVLEDDLKVRAVAVRRVFGFLACAQHGRLVLVGAEAKRRDTRRFQLVGAVAKRLRDRKYNYTD